MTTPLTALGSGTTIDYSTPSDPVLRIPYSAISTALNWGTVPTSSGTQDLDPWIASIVQALANWNAAQLTTVHDVAVSQPFVGTQNRNNINSRPTYTYSVAVYSKTPISNRPDADDLQG